MVLAYFGQFCESGSTWIRIESSAGIRIFRNADPDPDPGAIKIDKINKETWFPVFRKGFCTFVNFVGIFLIYRLFTNIFHVKIQLFVT